MLNDKHLVWKVLRSGIGGLHDFHVLKDDGDGGRLEVMLHLSVNHSLDLHSLVLNKASAFKAFISRFSCWSVTEWWHVYITSLFYLPRSLVRDLVESSFITISCCKLWLTWDKVQQVSWICDRTTDFRFSPKVWFGGGVRGGGWRAWSKGLQISAGWGGKEWSSEQSEGARLIWWPWFLLYELRNDSKGRGMLLIELKKGNYWVAQKRARLAQSVKKKKREINWGKEMLWSTEAYYLICK